MIASILWGVLYVLGALVGLTLILHAFACLFLGRRDKDYVDPYLQDSDEISVERGRWVEFVPKTACDDAAVIFHPGGYVDPLAYAPLFHRLAAASGVRCIIVPGPHRTPIAKRFSTDDVMAANPEIKHWFIAGHSQGGAVAALYMRDRLDDPAYAERIAGLIFLGFFVFDRHSLAKRDLPCLSIYGDRDGHADRFKPNEKNLPQGAEVVCIPGGNHRQFAAYSLHFPDGEPLISRDAQHDAALDALLPFLQKQLAQRG